jgi:uncharacterized membrane protein AbrB (regulator of aidB expression)
MRLKHARLRAPAGMMIGGTAFAAATFTGQGLKAAIPLEILTIVSAIGFYLLGKRDSDIGALMSHRRPDERQASIKIRSQAVAGRAMAFAAVAGCLIEIALKGIYWQLELIAAVGGLSFLAALAIYSGRDARAANGPDAEHEERSPVSH